LRAQFSVGQRARVRAGHGASVCWGKGRGEGRGVGGRAPEMVRQLGGHVLVLELAAVAALVARCHHELKGKAAGAGACGPSAPSMQPCSLETEGTTASRLSTKHIPSLCKRDTVAMRGARRLECKACAVGGCAKKPVCGAGRGKRVQGARMCRGESSIEARTAPSLLPLFSSPSLPSPACLALSP
jgi:hypothetical protein